MNFYLEKMRQNKRVMMTYIVELIFEVGNILLILIYFGSNEMKFVDK